MFRGIELGKKMLLEASTLDQKKKKNSFILSVRGEFARTVRIILGGAVILI